MEIQGKFKKIGTVQTIGNNNFKKLETVITTGEQYPQDIMIEFVQDKSDLPQSYKVGDEVKISFNIRGREWINPQGEAKYFNSLQGWKIERVGVAEASQTTVHQAEVVSQQVEDHDSLPF